MTQPAIEFGGWVGGDVVRYRCFKMSVEWNYSFEDRFGGFWGLVELGSRCGSQGRVYKT